MWSVCSAMCGVWSVALASYLVGVWRACGIATCTSPPWFSCDRFQVTACQSAFREI